MSESMLIGYATYEGHTRHLANHLAHRLRKLGAQVSVYDVAVTEADPSAFDQVILAASVHLGRHERAMVDFVRRHKDLLEKRPTTFLSVGVSEAAATHAPTPEQRRDAQSAARHAVDLFCRETEWWPDHVELVAGALKYSRYNALIRFITRQLARRRGVSPDTKVDHDYTDYDALDRLATRLVEHTQ